MVHYTEQVDKYFILRDIFSGMQSLSQGMVIKTFLVYSIHLKNTRTRQT